MGAETLAARQASVNVDRYAADPGRVVGGNAVRLLHNGVQAFPAWLDAIDQARERVSLEMYIFNDDTVGRRFSDALLGAVQRGVTVRLLYDYIGCRYTPSAFFERMREGGIRTIVYHGHRGWRPKIWKLFRRNHRKTLVVDGHVAFTGGLNISTEWLPAAEGGDDWHDAVIQIRGPAVQVVEASFAAVWNRRSPKRFRLDVPAGPGADVAGATPIAILVNSERHERFTIRRAVLHAMRVGARRIWVANPYFAPDGGVLRTLRLAAQVGIDVRVLLPRESDSEILDAAARATFARLLKARVRIWQSRQVLHTKAILVDDAFVSIGTYNFDHRSLAYNLEMMANVFDQPFAAAVDAMLAYEMTTADEVTMATVEARPMLLRLFDRLALSLRRWL